MTDQSIQAAATIEGAATDNVTGDNSTVELNPGESPVGGVLDELEFRISEFRDCRDNLPKPRVHSWKTFSAAFGQHAVRLQKDGPAWSPASYRTGATRCADNVERISMAVVDVDGGISFDELRPRLNGYAYLIHSSYRHTPEQQKFRVILPFSKPVDPAEWPSVWARINAFVGGVNDPATKDACRLYYKPVHAPDAQHHFVRIQEGRPIRLEDLPDIGDQMPQDVQKTSHRVSGTAAADIEGIESNGSDLNFEQGLRHVVDRCAFMQFASAPENQEGIPEPLWMAMISNACRFENSEPWIHAASEGHPQYSRAQTDARIDRYRIGPPPVTCHRIRELGFEGCPSGGCSRPNGLPTKAPAGLMGWMFHSQLTHVHENGEQLPESYTVGQFQVRPEGVYQPVYKGDELVDYVRISSRIDVVALTRDPESTNWGLHIRLVDPDGNAKFWAMPNETLAGQGDSYRSAFLRMGASVNPSKAAREGLATYLTEARPQGRALAVRQPGWFNGLFVLPDAVYGRSDQRIVFQTNDPDEIKRFSRNGMLETWQREVALPCQENSRPVVSICIALACPLLALLGEDNGGFHIRGNSSVGKSICLALGASVWGAPGLIRTWNMTVNGIEGVASAHNDILLAMDELGQMDVHRVGETIYSLGNGQGKGRATKDGDARTVRRWRNLFLSSGEKSLEDAVTASGQLVMAGQEVRMVEIVADAGRGYGVFEDIHGASSSRVFAERLRQQILENHGHAGRAFVELLANVELQPKLLEKLKTLIQRFVESNVPENATGQVGRVGRRFGLVAATGELCIELGILPWPEGEAFDACRKCFMDWIDLRGGIGNHEGEQAIGRVRRFIELHGESRFTPWTMLSDNNGDGRTIQRAGFRRTTEDGRTEYFVLPEVWRTEVCAGMNPTMVSKTLADRGYLARDSAGKLQVEKRPPGMGKIRLYHLSADLMGEAVSHAENEETSRRPSTVSVLSRKYNV